MNPIDYVLILIIALIFGKALHVTVKNFRSDNPCSACNGGVDCPACKNRKKNITTSVIILSTCVVISGCGEESAAVDDTPKIDLSIDLSQSKDGIFEAESSLDKALGRGYITLEIKDHQIVNVSYIGKDLFGNDKDENYGGDKDSADYRKAQVAVEAMKKYPAQLLEFQRLDRVDAISGATISYEQFVEATKEAVKKSVE